MSGEGRPEHDGDMAAQLGVTRLAVPGQLVTTAVSGPGTTVRRASTPARAPTPGARQESVSTTSRTWPATDSGSGA